ncbi:sensor histidine kinase [Paracoccus sp. PAR01]|uniref:sensor histidine kinase n=1 Tax=Paracoccus sp. PAR01 TaxID=2769282 RepID=UPI00178376AD|nr:ATP-binding protein [Paracoccus sp. PAR01]MBD9528352.1 two-component sensor histidine kinase [Paracoccus sp. PAR01]
MSADATTRISWKGATLATRYALASGIVLILAALLISSFITRRIEANVVSNSANSTALFMDSVLSPLAQDLATQDRLGPGAQQALDEIFLNTPLADRVLSYKIWKPGGLIAQASDPALIGRTFPVSDSLTRALHGEVAAEFSSHSDEEDRAERAFGVPLLEIYSPIRKDYTGEVIAVAEFYEFHEQLEADLAAARRDTRLAVAGVIAGLGLVLYLIVLRASHMIQRQQDRLSKQFAELQTMAQRNRRLRDQVRDAAGRAADATEHSLRRIGADLHDGPAQQLAFAALHLDGLRERQASSTDAAEIAAVEQALAGAMTEIRAISRGLALPEIAGKTPAQITRMAVDEHRLRTGNPVLFEVDGDNSPDLPPAADVCLYRFVQEGLNNAARHAGAEGLAVRLTMSERRLELRVIDAGPGIPSDPGAAGLGLAGLRDRVESLGGSFRAGQAPEGGGLLELVFDPGEWK